MKNGMWGALVGALVSVVVLSGVALVGCTTQQAAEFKAAEAVLVSDIETGASLVVGLGTALQQSVSADPAAWAKVGAVAKALAKKAGVSAVDQATLSADVTPENLAAVIAVATRIQTSASRIQVELK